ncbi:FAD-binding oxidoreductase [Novosphingobium sp.]|uniref:FAD-binding oxidoreductase n=1 Tax=Novosphingobium sp. TaxID=1874826 RepID=UPI0026067644|nr:FAD-binding oxidoreductase [Novosphingobium sp.]
MADLAILPKGVNKEAFLAAVERYRAIVGHANVIVDPDRLQPYERMMIPGERNRFRPAGAILVSSVEQVQQVLAVCNQTGIPVWPISTGGNLGYGERQPAVGGQMVLDLGRMNRIIEVDPVLCTALVEPGVTYHQLYEYLNSRGIPLWLSVPGPGPLVGPMGQALERGQGYTAIAEQFESICGMEVVLADGTLLRTGMGGVQGTKAWQAFKYGYGPHSDGIFTQSNFGVVTKLGLWLTPRPEKIKIFAASFNDFGDIGKAVDAARELKLAKTVEGPILCGIPVSQLQMANGRRDKVKTDPAPITREWLNTYLDEQGMPKVGAFGSVTGSQGEVDAKYAEVKRVFAKHGGQVVDELFLQISPMFGHMVDSMTGVPDLQEMNMLNWVGGGGNIWCGMICPARGDEVVGQVDLGWEIMLKHGFDYNGGFFHNGRSVIHAMSILFDKNDPAQDTRALACFDEIVTRFAAKGYAQYRTNIAFMDKTADHFGSAQRAFNAKLKTALDPQAVIAPGKSGIFPIF